MARLSIFAPVFLLSFAPLLSASSASAAPETLRVLMVGNSRSKGIRRPLEDLAESRGISRKVSLLARNGATLEDLLAWPRTAKKLAGGPWDYVIVQEQSAGMFASRYSAARELDARIAATGSPSILMMTWRDRGDFLESYDTLRGVPDGTIGYVPIAYELGVSLAPVGWAFRAAVADGVGDKLWGRDGHHVSVGGGSIWPPPFSSR